MQNITIQPYCSGIQETPFLVLFLTVLVLCHFLPLILFYLSWDGEAGRGDGDLICGGEWFRIPSISKTWRNLKAVFSVFLGAVIDLETYVICMDDMGILVCIILGLIGGVLVFAINPEEGSLTYLHLTFALIFFVYLLWAVAALRVYLPPGYIWYWPYIPMGVCLLLILFYCIENAHRKKKKQDKFWPSYVSLAEHIYLFTFEIFLVTIHQIST